MAYNDIASSLERAGTQSNVKINSEGALEFHRGMTIRPDTRCGVSVCLDAKDMSQQPKLGFTLDLAP
jgi:hypothetical protein